MFEFINNRNVIVGENALAKLPQSLRWNECKRIFLTVFQNDASIVRRIIEDLTREGFHITVYDKIVSEPDLIVIDSGAEAYQKSHCDCIVAVGGGSVIDASKAIAMLVKNGGCIEEYQMEGRVVKHKPAVFFTVPTTAGTGAEATKISVIVNNHNGWKKSVYHDSMIAETVFLDPSAILSLPRKIMVSTGMDAITHAIESYISLNATPISEMQSLKALELLSSNIECACREPENLEAKTNMLLGSYLGGCAINCGISLAHIVGQPLGAIYHIPHGDACSIFLTHSMRANLSYATAKLARVARELKADAFGLSDEEAALEGIRWIERLKQTIGAPGKLTDYVKAKDIDVEYAVEFILESMGHLKNNPRPLEAGVLREMIQAAI